ncbi:MAG TPA: type II toxin-antitoxin system VapC family toxin [Roseiflexaceae bacterium]|nr:type II toxin-antitoxin system VapC family toxin [Roseiflexaceae bacterium]
MLPPEIFLDTAFALALANPNDLLHGRATLLADQIETAGIRLITTRAVLLEIGNALARLRYRAASLQLLTALETDPSVEIVSLTDDLYDRAFQLYRTRPDKEWGLTDCASFVVMQDRGLTAALTPDKHYQQAGYQALLRDKTT